MKSVRLDLDQVSLPAPGLRRSINQERLEGLASSMREVGLLHPILVRECDDRYVLVAGERRLLAARLAGHQTIEAIVMSGDIDTVQVQLIENLHREDLNPVERAEAVSAFMSLHSLNKSTAAQRLGVPRTTLTDWLDLLEVAPRFRNAVIDNFNGGDSPLTPSHISEALALARRLNSPHLDEVLLEAVLRHKLSKAETRQVAQIIREQRDTSVEEAIRAIRMDYSEPDTATAADQIPLLPHEANLQVLVMNLDRSARVLERMGHVSGRFIEPETARRLTENYQRIVELAERAMARLCLEDPDLLRQIEREQALLAAQAKRQAAKRGKRRVKNLAPS